MGNKVAKENLNKNSGKAHKLVLSFTFLFPYKNLRLHNFQIRTESQQTEIILKQQVSHTEITDRSR